MKRILPAYWVLMASQSLHAQAPVPSSAEPAQLVNTRAVFLRQVMKDSQLLTEQYERALTKAESEVAATGDYEEARAIRQRREQLQALYAGTASSLATPLPLEQARLTGSAQASGEMLSGWRSEGSGAEWVNFRVVPGSYHLEFEVCMSDAPVAGSIYASSKFQPKQSAMFEFNEVTLLGAAPESVRTFEVTRSQDETTFATMRVGPVSFSRTPVTLHFGASGGYPANIIRVRNLRLVRVTDEATEEPASKTTASTAALQQATAALKTALETARATAIQSYLANLRALAVAKPALKDQIEAESQNVQRGKESISGPAGVRAVTSVSGGMNGFEILNDAHLADEEPVSGDRFKVEHEGRVLPVRLLWVDCAPVESNGPGVKAFAKHFDIDEEDVAAIGRAAREYTSGYLRGKSLRLLARPDRDKDGTLAVLVFLPDVGLYQNVLVDHGLAAVVSPREAKRGAPERALLSTLQARENAARAHLPPLGAWALSTNSEGEKKQ